MPPDVESPPLAAVAAAFARDELTRDQVAAAFLDSAVFATRTGDGERPGVWVSGGAGHEVLCVFTDLALLARAVVDRPGTPMTYLSTTGRDLLSLLPAGCDVVVDPLGPTTVQLSHRLLHRVAGEAS